MKLVISKRFVKDTQKIRDDRILLKLRQIIAALEACGSLEDITEASGLSVYRYQQSKAVEQIIKVASQAALRQ